jgi:hypothetical protein
MIQSLRVMKEKIGGIERHYGMEILTKLQQLRTEVACKVEGLNSVETSENNEDQWSSIEGIASDIMGKVSQVVK